MKRISLTIALTALGSPVLAAGGDYPWYSLNDTNFVVAIAFVIFVGILIYFGVPKMVGKLLDDRAEGIKADIDEARSLREEAQTILASFERKHKEVQSQVEGIIEHAKSEAETAAEAAKAELKDNIARRIAAAEDQIKSAEEAAVRQVKDEAIAVAIDAAQDVIAKKMTAKDAGSLIDEAIDQVGAKLH